VGVDVRGRPLAAKEFDGINDGILDKYRQRKRGADTVMPLTDTRVRTAKSHDRPYKLSDGGGMYLLVKPDGGRYWRMDYRVVGKRRTLAFGIYPTVTLLVARTRREEARRLLAQGIDPNAAKKATKRADKLASTNTFSAVARELACQPAPSARSKVLVTSHLSS
jgi:hypothetical protein